MKAETKSIPKRRLQDATRVWLDERRSLILSEIDATRCKSFGQDRLDFAEAAKLLPVVQPMRDSVTQIGNHTSKSEA